jgi:hypothetical protein
VTERVVDRLEVVQVHEQDRHRQVGPRQALQRVLDAVAEQRSVREPRDRVVERLVRQLLLECLALRDVPRVEDDPLHVGVVHQVGPEGLDVEPEIVAVPHPGLDQLRRRSPLPDGRREELQDLGLVVGMDEAGELGPLQLRGVVAEHAFHRRAHVAHGRVDVDHHDDVGGVLDERAEAGLRLLAEQVLGQGGTVQRQRHLRGQSLQRVLVRARQDGLTPDHQEASELILHEQRAAEQAGGLLGEPQRAGELGLVQRHLVRTMAPEPVSLPLRQEREGDRVADDPFVASGRGDHAERIAFAVAREDPDHGALARDRARRLEGGRVDPFTVRRRDERGTGPAERALSDGGLLLFADQAGDPDDDQEEQRRGRADQDREVAAQVSEVLDHHHAGREKRREREQPEPTPRQAWLNVR